MTHVTETDAGKLWIIRENGGRADLVRPRSPRQHEWLAYAVDEGWLSHSGRLTTLGRRIADTYQDGDTEETT